MLSGVKSLGIVRHREFSLCGFRIGKRVAELEKSLLESGDFLKHQKKRKDPTCKPTGRVNFRNIPDKAPRDGFEPSALRLTAACSTVELPGIVLQPLYNVTGTGFKIKSFFLSAD